VFKARRLFWCEQSSRFCGFKHGRQIQKIHTAALLRKSGSFASAITTSRDVFDFVKSVELRSAGCVDLQRGVKLLYNLALLASQLRRRQHTHMIIKIAAPSAMRIGQALPLIRNNRSALRTFRNFSRSPGRPGLEIVPAKPAKC